MIGPAQQSEAVIEETCPSTPTVRWAAAPSAPTGNEMASSKRQQRFAQDTREHAQSSLPATDETHKIGFNDLPLELREMIWSYALPEPRVFNALVWVSSKLKMQLLNRSELKLSLAHTCFEARRVVSTSGYVLAFRDEDEPDDPGVWFNPKRDRIERTIWGPGDWAGTY